LPDRYAKSGKRDGYIIIGVKGKSAKFNEVRKVINISYYGKQYCYNTFATRFLIS